MMHRASTGSGFLMIQVPPPERLGTRRMQTGEMLDRVERLLDVGINPERAYLRVAFYTFQRVSRRRHSCGREALTPEP